jgi:hypothetical protein
MANSMLNSKQKLMKRSKVVLVRSILHKLSHLLVYLTNNVSGSICTHAVVLSRTFGFYVCLMA